MNVKIIAGSLLLAGSFALAIANNPPQTQTYAHSARITMPDALDNEPGQSPFGAELQQQPRTYTIRKGDLLSSIALRFYGNARLWRKIADANGIPDPRRIHPDQVIVIPE